MHFAPESSVPATSLFRKITLITLNFFIPLTTCLIKKVCTRLVYLNGCKSAGLLSQRLIAAVDPA